MGDPQPDSEPRATKGILSRPGVWLGTVSTVVAIATGMFSLRDQIFPSDAGTAAASTIGYQTSVGEICMALNQANGALNSNADNLARRLAKARTPLAQRNAVLDSWNVVLNSSQYELGMFEGLDVPSGLAARERMTAAAWSRIVARLRGFTKRLDAASDDAALMAAVLTLPAMGQANAADLVTRTAGLTELGGGRCQLDRPANVRTITLPLLPGGSTVAVSVAPTPSAGSSHRASSAAAQRASATASEDPAISDSVGAVHQAASPTGPEPTAPSRPGGGSPDPGRRAARHSATSGPVVGSVPGRRMTNARSGWAGSSGRCSLLA